ncbi:MAG: hypothetical protein HY683_06310 [Chloroflexi bacterium]|nr:hypothetical protein [Chloroflexota bacterium]
MQCTYHPDTETVLRCSKCETPICPRCLVQTPVGARCRDCARLSRLPTYAVRPVVLLRGLVAGLATGLALGLALAVIVRLGMVPLFLAVWVAPGYFLGAGYLVGEAVSLATNRKRGGLLQAIAVLGYIVAFLGLQLLTPLVSWGSLFTVAAFIVGLAIAIGRLR